MKPRSCRQSTITCVSSLQSAPRSVVSPSAKAARTKARFVMLLEPGTVTSAREGGDHGTISMTSGRAMQLFRRGAALALPGVAALFGFGEESVDGLRVPFLQGGAECLQVIDEASQFANNVVAIAECDIAPHLRRAGGDTGGVTKTVGAEQGLVFGAIGP